MKSRNVSDYVADLLASIDEVQSFTENMSFDEFAKDKKTVNAVIRSLEVLGEAAKSIPEALRIHYPKIPWKRMAGMRDKLIHEYFGVDLDIVWVVIKEELPPLRSLLHDFARDFEREVGAKSSS